LARLSRLRKRQIPHALIEMCGCDCRVIWTLCGSGIFRTKNNWPARQVATAAEDRLRLRRNPLTSFAAASDSRSNRARRTLALPKNKAQTIAAIIVKLTMDYYFQPGNKEGKGRPVGVPNRRSRELAQRLKDRGDTDPADFLSSIVSNPNEPTELKVAASNYLLPYLYSKRGALFPPRYIELEIDVTEFTTFLRPKLLSRK